MLVCFSPIKRVASDVETWENSMPRMPGIAWDLGLDLDFFALALALRWFWGSLESRIWEYRWDIEI